MKFVFRSFILMILLQPASAQSVAPYSTPNENLEYLNVVQKATFKYFWDFAHPVSGLAPERTATPNIVTSGGSGFGVLAIVVGAHRQWITKQQAINRLNVMVDFLAKADRFHGAWSHWLDGNTGKVVPFSPYDDGGDLVETAYLMNGLLVAKEYFQGNSKAETVFRQKVEQLYNSIEWSWFVRDGLLLWHWSPKHAWKMNHPIAGYNECLITHLLALASPKFGISYDVYQKTWKQYEAWHYKNGKEFAGYTLPIGFDFGGPLFFSHYSYLTLDPATMQDEDCNYWDLNLRHTLINRQYCIDSAPKSFGYTEENWGLTASDNHEFYGAHNPKEDNGTITPTAALSAFPYTPHFSMQVLMNLYRREGNRLFGEYGFFDAYNKLKGWYSNQYLAIDQGPIVAMIENYRTGLLWELGTKSMVLTNGLEKAKIYKPIHETGFYKYIPDTKTKAWYLMKHPEKNKFVLDFWVKGTDAIDVFYTKIQGGEPKNLFKNVVFNEGKHKVEFEEDFGDYEFEILQGSKKIQLKIALR